MRLSAIGDTCHALAVIRRLQDNWPEADITWVIGKTEASLMADIPDIRFVVFDKSRGRAAYRDVRAAMQGQHFDVALCMHASLRANLLTGRERKTFSGCSPTAVSMPRMANMRWRP